MPMRGISPQETLALKQRIGVAAMMNKCFPRITQIEDVITRKDACGEVTEAGAKRGSR